MAELSLTKSQLELVMSRSVTFKPRLGEYGALAGADFVVGDIFIFHCQVWPKNKPQDGERAFFVSWPRESPRGEYDKQGKKVVYKKAGILHPAIRKKYEDFILDSFEEFLKENPDINRKSKSSEDDEEVVEITESSLDNFQSGTNATPRSTQNDEPVYENPDDPPFEVDGQAEYSGDIISVNRPSAEAPTRVRQSKLTARRRGEL